MLAFNIDYEIKRKEYESEVNQRFGETDAYKEHIEKTASYSKENWQEINSGLDSIMAKFAKCLKHQYSADSENVQEIVKELQRYITDNYYTCTNEILAGLGQMYVSDERFKENIDKHLSGTAMFISEAINVYCK